MQPFDLRCGTPDHRRGARRTPSVNQVALEKAAGLMKALGDVPRMRLVALLAQGEACVSELAAAGSEKLSTVSQRLKVLRAEGLVVRRREGKHINYALTDQHVVDLIFNALAHASEGERRKRRLTNPNTKEGNR